MFATEKCSFLMAQSKWNFADHNDDLEKNYLILIIQEDSFRLAFFCFFSSLAIPLLHIISTSFHHCLLKTSKPGIRFFEEKNRRKNWLECRIDTPVLENISNTSFYQVSTFYRYFLAIFIFLLVSHRTFPLKYLCVCAVQGIGKNK